MELKKKQRLSDILVGIFDSQHQTCILGELADNLEHHGIAIVLIMFSIPAALPIPAAGYSTLLSIPLLIIGIRLILGIQTIWLPTKMRSRKFDPSEHLKLYRTIMKIVCFIERFSKPRLVSFVQSKMSRILLGVLICALACSMALPIPGTNTLPAGGIFLIGFSLLEDDGLLLLAGIVYSFLALCLSIFIIVFGYEVVRYAISAFFSRA